VNVDPKIRQNLLEKVWVLEKANQYNNELWNDSIRFLGIDKLVETCQTCTCGSIIKDPYDSADTESSSIMTVPKFSINCVKPMNCSVQANDLQTIPDLSSIRSAEPSFSRVKQKILSRFRSQQKTKKLLLEFEKELSDDQSKILIDYLTPKNVIVSTTDKKLFVILYTGNDINRFTRKYGYLSAIQNKISFENPCNLLADDKLNPKSKGFFSQENWNMIASLMKFSFLPHSEIKRFIIRGLDDKTKILAAKKLISKLKSTSKRYARKQKLINSVDKVYGFSGENLYKREILIDGKSLVLYYSIDVIQFIQDGKFDLMLIDSTHLKMMRKNQITIVRFYSEITNKVLTAMYAINPSKKAESYSQIFMVLDELKVMDNCKAIMADFELAIRKGFEMAIRKPIVFRMCFYHLISATRRYASSINKTISIENQQKARSHPPTSPQIFRLFSLLIFIPKQYQKAMFNVFKFLMRSFTKRISNEMFMEYFRCTYIDGPLSKHFFLDFQDSSVITNNFLEGINSSLKRHNRGRVNIETFLDWMRIDCKQTIMNLQVIPRKSCQANPKFREFYVAFASHKDFMTILFDYISQMGSLKPFDQKMALRDLCRSEFYSLREFVSGTCIEWDEFDITVKMNGKEIFIASIHDAAAEDNQEYWANIEPEFSTFFRRMRYK